MVCFGNRADDGQAEPEMLTASRPVVRPSETLEDRLAVLAGNAGPGITDPEFYRVARKPRAQFDRIAC